MNNAETVNRREKEGKTMIAMIGVKCSWTDDGAGNHTHTEIIKVRRGGYAGRVVGYLKWERTNHLATWRDSARFPTFRVSFC
jgi:hypothetical protein